MNAKIIFLLSLVIMFPVMLFANNSLAVLPFGYANEYTQMTIAQNLTDSVENWMVEFGVFNVVERERLKDIIKEQKLSLAGFVEPKTAISIGKLVGAQYVSFGSVTDVKFNDDGTVSGISATMKVINTTTGVIAYSTHSSISGLSSSNLINDLAMDLTLKICSGITGKRVVLPMNLRWERYGSMVWGGLITSALTIPGVMDDFWTSMAYAEGYDPSVGTSTQYILFVSGLVTSGYGIAKIYIMPDVYQPTVNRNLFGYNRIYVPLINTKF